MSTTAPPAAPTATRTLLDRYQDIFGPTGFLGRYNVERKEEIELLGLATISGVDLLFLGDPGVGKTWAIELLTNHALTDMTLFTHLLAKDQSVAELLGEKDVMAMKQGVTARITAGTLTEANYAYLDEIFKASPPMLNPLLDIFAKRELKIGGKVISCKQLLSIFMSSNELPDREDLFAFRDRIAITKHVQPVRTPEGRREVTDIQLDYDLTGIDVSDLEPLTLDEIFAIRDEVRRITVPDVIRDTMGDIERKCLEAGHPISQRRKRDIWRTVKSRAWASGASEVTADHFLPAQHMCWNHPDHADSAHDIIVEVASQFTRKALRLREAMEPVLLAMEELRAKITAASESDVNDLMDEGFKFLTQLRKLRREAVKQIADGREQGQDVSTTQEVLDEIDKAHKWGEKALVGGEDTE